MRARILAVMVTALVLALAAPALAGPREDAQARRKAMAERTARAAVIQNGETKENLEQVVVNHLGSPDQGQVLIQTWV
jgi:type II secretory pathway pseudopilin PulG